MSSSSFVVVVVLTFPYSDEEGRITLIFIAFDFFVAFLHFIFIFHCDACMVERNLSYDFLIVVHNTLVVLVALLQLAVYSMYNYARFIRAGVRHTIGKTAQNRRKYGRINGKLVKKKKISVWREEETESTRAMGFGSVFGYRIS